MNIFFVKMLIQDGGGGAAQKLHKTTPENNLIEYILVDVIISKFLWLWQSVSGEVGK